MRTVAIVQARMGSHRFPGKVLEAINGRPMLHHIIQRLRRVDSLNEIVVATSHLKINSQIVRACEDIQTQVFRGSEDDVLDRYYRAASDLEAEVIVRITADCPLIDPGICGAIINAHRAAPVDYTSNTQKRSYPRGLDVEVFSMEALMTAWAECDNTRLREHVTMYIVRHPERFRLQSIEHGVDLSFHRWTVDEAADLEFVRAVYGSFPPESPFTWTEVLDLLRLKPELIQINQHVHQNEVRDDS